MNESDVRAYKEVEDDRMREVILFCDRDRTHYQIKGRIRSVTPTCAELIGAEIAVYHYGNAVESFVDKERDGGASIPLRDITMIFESD